MELIHGGDIYSYAETYGGALPLDLSANINPLGIPPRVRAAMQNAVDDCERYPDPLCRELRRAIAAREAVPMDWIFCGNGAAEVLFRLAASIRPKRALLLAPTFAEYEQSLAGCDLQFHMLRHEEGFAVTERLLDEITDELDAVYLCNPNNPTGRTIAPLLLERIAEKCNELGIWLLLDECFLDFLVGEDVHTCKGLLKNQPKLILLRAFTKMYAVPGVRLGYCMTANDALIQALYRAGQPWNVSVIAQACGVAACKEVEYAKETARVLSAERNFLMHELRARELFVFEGEANFLLFYTKYKDLHCSLAAHGVLIRNCENYRGLSAGYYRIAVRQRADSLRFLNAFDAIRRA